MASRSLLLNHLARGSTGRQHRPSQGLFSSGSTSWLLAPSAQQRLCQPLLAGKPSRFPFCSLCLLLLCSGLGSLLRAGLVHPGVPASCRLCGPSGHCPHTVSRWLPGPTCRPVSHCSRPTNSTNSSSCPGQAPQMAAQHVSPAPAPRPVVALGSSRCRVAPCAAPEPEAPSDGQAEPSMAGLHTPVASPAWETWRHPNRASRHLPQSSRVVVPATVLGPLCELYQALGL